MNKKNLSILALILAAGLASPALGQTCPRNLILCGETRAAELTAADCPQRPGEFADFWYFPGQARMRVNVQAESGQFDTFLVLTDLVDRLYAVNDNLPGTTNSGLTATLPSTTFWKIGVTASGSAEPQTGSYRLRLECGGGCSTSATTLCLNRRFRVQVRWRNQFNGEEGFGRAIPRTGVSGFFSFGDPANLELMVKVLDFGDHFKVFYGQLTNLQFTVQVTDTVTGASKSYGNTPGDCGGIDTAGFAQSLAPGAGALAALTPAPQGVCAAGSGNLCLLGRRFQVEVDWRNQFDGSSGRGGAVGLSGLTGAFYFTDASNLELLVKLLEFPDRIAVFWGTLSNLEYTLRVTDTATGTVKTYHNPPGQYCGGLDNGAFPG